MVQLSQDSIGYSAAALQAGDVREALAIRNQEFQQNSGPFDETVVRTMELILSKTPVLLFDCPEKVLAPLRVAAALMELWGETDIRHFVTVEGELDYRFSIAAIAHLLHSHGSFLAKLEEFRRAGISHVTFLGADGPYDCDACRNADGMKFTIDSVPELPLADCTCEDEYGCRVIVAADLDDAS
jgi:hypothetical protein